MLLIFDLINVDNQVLKGLVYLHHERHVIHRDIKPSNLLVNHKGEVKITDFGVSAVLASSMGQRDTFVGTYNYMSPERISGSSYDYKSDIWSLGLVVLECAIGRFPYIPSEESEVWLSFYELLEAIVDQPPPSAPSDQFSPEFCSFISAWYFFYFYNLCILDWCVVLQGLFVCVVLQGLFVCVNP